MEPDHAADLRRGARIERRELTSWTDPLSMPRVPRPESIDVSAVDAAFHDRLHAAIDALTDPATVGAPWTVLPMTGGATNLNFCVQAGDTRYALRVCGGDIARRVSVGSRAYGAEIQTAVAAGGVGVPLYAYALPDGHLLAEFIDDAVTLSPGEMRTRNLIPAMARILRTLHDLPPIGCTWSAVEDIEHYRGVADRERLALPDDVDFLQQTATEISDVTSSVPGALGLCHNDLQIPNFLLDGQRLWLVDWEWAGMANRYFDLGAVMVNGNFSREEAAVFCGEYFGGAVDLEAELARAELMTLVSAVREALWSVAAGPVLPNDWDYAAWAETYFDRARTMAHSDRFRELLALAAPRPCR
jgi:thiamine kinase-like enzyme